ncbi:isochorismate synthase [Acinetobacter larvae]|uniref:isochorismate synthase n=1 Tax=Acinetobacter larvae TaxID=1789224 RepID=A0A1B2M0U5_9GAMM|nr:isochorismate synthase [Acinetobacter larvae]AOA58795.1 hypothetical protein BFG52_10840 [Acinetobacter larvae]
MLATEIDAFKNVIGIKREELFVENLAGFVFASPTGMISSKKIIQNIDFCRNQDLNFLQQQQTWLDQAKQQLQDQIKACSNTELIIVGSLAFDTRDLPELSIAEAKNTYLADAAKGEHNNAFHLGSVEAKLLPQHAEYVGGVQKLVDLMQNTALKKAVLARVVDLTVTEKINILQLFYRLYQANPEGYTFAYAQNPTHHGWFMGASPELLVAKQNANVFSQPVAGTLIRSEDATEDKLQAERLLASSKDQSEHRLVIESIADLLTPFCKELHIPKKPSLIKTQTLWHLATSIQGKLKDPELHVFDLVSVLHPTPAVCGAPAQLARALISELEPFQRNLFAGTMGWSDAYGNGAWSVNVRCGRIHDQFARLYAGAGIVEASKPELELDETAAKFKTMLNALGLNTEQLIFTE